MILEASVEAAEVNDQGCVFRHAGSLGYMVSMKGNEFTTWNGQPITRPSKINPSIAES